MTMRTTTVAKMMTGTTRLTRIGATRPRFDGSKKEPI